ncbi:hypothetical protein PV04_06214 [Phialophora macrospora]|uniref:Transcription factor domain-containing protein n=1 Tax=Phialophora macrospora TaxID=1851006 RepID=A0A0D2DXT9_9EURO|nr:hypothetical protein PV04_06214 [Phialophora macrospora]
MPPATYQGSFHFVNKTGSNLTRRDSEEAFLISSHVTNKYYQWAKRTRNKQPLRHTNSQPPTHHARRRLYAEEGHLSRSSSPLSVVSSESRGDHSNDESHCKTICWQLESGAKTIARRTASPRTSPEPPAQLFAMEKIDEQYIRPELWPDYLHRVPNPSLTQQFDFNAPDWAACPHFQRQALEFYRSFFLSYSYAGAQQSSLRQLIGTAWHKRATTLVTDKKSLHGWFASVLILKALYMEPEAFTILYPMALRHQNTSLMLLREYIREENGPSESLLLCIWCIATSAFFCGDIQSNLAHVPTLWDTVDKLGGIDALNPETRAQVVLMDNGHSRFTLTRPHLHYSQFDPGAFQDQPGLSQYGYLLSDMEVQYRRWDEAFLLPDDALSEDLHSYIMAHREFMAAHALASRLSSEKEQCAADTIFYWLHRRRATLSSWTMTLYCDIVETITPQTRLSRCIRRQLQACVCLAVSYAMSFVYGFTLPLKLWLLYIPVQNLRPQLEILLQDMEKRGTMPSVASSATCTSSSVPPLAISHHETLLFLFFVGACAEEIPDEAGKRPELLIDRRWHSTRFCEMTKILGLRTWKETKRVLQRFLYGDGVVLDRFVEGLFELRNNLADTVVALRAG